MLKRVSISIEANNKIHVMFSMCWLFFVTNRFRRKKTFATNSREQLAKFVRGDKTPPSILLGDFQDTIALRKWIFTKLGEESLMIEVYGQMHLTSAQVSSKRRLKDANLILVDANHDLLMPGFGQPIQVAFGIWE